MAKGAEFEREICYQLTDWWSRGKAEDVLFWRTRNSGGRATIRHRKGKKTLGHCGDIEAVNEIGKALTSLITFELKNGYQTATLHDLLDRSIHKEQPYEGWIDQAWQAAVRAGTPFWSIIHHRRKRDALMVLPGRLAQILSINEHTSNGRFLRLEIKNRWKFTDQTTIILVCLPFADFLEVVTPAEIKAVSPFKIKGQKSDPLP